jgi:hypothetical protein
VAEAISEYNVATRVSHICGRLVASIGLIYSCSDYHLIISESERGLDFLHRIDEVRIIGRVLIVQTDKTNLDII